MLRQVYTWGRSDYGQLGYRSRDADSVPSVRSFTSIPKEVPELKGIKKVFVMSKLYLLTYVNYIVRLLVDQSIL